MRLLRIREALLICHNGKPVAELRPYPIERQRKLGVLKGKIEIADDFDALPDCLLFT